MQKEFNGSREALVLVRICQTTIKLLQFRIIGVQK
jgi:hypothetical protein